MPLPTKSTIYKNIQRNEDSRGGILSIVDDTIENVSLIKPSTTDHPLYNGV